MTNVPYMEHSIGDRYVNKNKELINLNSIITDVY